MQRIFVGFEFFDSRIFWGGLSKVKIFLVFQNNIRFLVKNRCLCIVSAKCYKLSALKLLGVFKG